MVEGLNFALQYQGTNGSASESNNYRDVLAQNGNGYGMSVSYDLGYGISAAGAFFSADRTADQNGRNNPAILGNGDKAQAYSTGLKYDANNVYLAAMFTQSYNANRFGSRNSQAYGFADKAQNIELVAQYQFDFGLRPSVAYVQSNAKDIQGFGSQNLVKYVDLGATYAFNKNMSTYVDHKINLLDENDFTSKAGLNTDNVTSVGIVYQF
ncbi:Outer membrane protein C precursor [compost metagenome]